MLRLFSPLTATRYPRYDWDDINGEEEELLPTELCNYQKEILDQIAKERLSEEGDRGLAEYLNDEGLKEKIYSMNPTVEVWRGELWGVLEVEYRGELSSKEIEDIKEYWEGQASDGWGEGFEQREIKTCRGDVFVSFWNSEHDYFIITEEELKGQEQPSQKGGMKANMTYEEFLKLTKKNLKRFFPESFQERKVEIMEVLKNNNIKLQGVYLPGTKSYTSVPLLYLESYYQELEDGKKLEDVWQKIAQDYQKCQEAEISIDGISSREWDYETIKKSLTVYVRNAQENTDFLASCPHEIREDLALVYGFHVLVDGEKAGSAIINYDRLRWLGVSEEQLKQDAWENMKQSNPPCFLDLQDMLAKMYSDELGDVKAGSLEYLEDVDPNAMMYVLTNSNQVNGAVYMCDEEVMSLIAEKLGSDLIVIPSSIHETIILKETENVSVTELNAMVEAVNEEAVTPQEKLGNSVYRFDREAQRLEKAVEQAEKLDFEPGMSPVFS